MTRWKISADTGGTFTDCLAESDGGVVRRGKVLSSGRLRTRIRRGLAQGQLSIDPFPVPDPGWLVGKAASVQNEPAGRILAAEEGILRLEFPPESIRAGDLLEVDSGVEDPVLAMQLLVPEIGKGRDTVEFFRLGTTRGTNALLEKKALRWRSS